jgi:hypothetical protein
MVQDRKSSCWKPNKNGLFGIERYGTGPQFAVFKFGGLLSSSVHAITVCLSLVQNVLETISFLYLLGNTLGVRVKTLL